MYSVHDNIYMKLHSLIVNQWNKFDENFVEEDFFPNNNKKKKDLFTDR